MDAALVAAWKDLCQQLAPAFTAPTLVTFLHLTAGWVLCRSRPAVTGLVLTVGERLLGHAAKHWTAYERFFYRAAWSLDELSRLLLVRVVVPLVDAFGEDGPGSDGPPPVSLNIDDTTAARYGRHVAYAGYFKDASASNVLKTVCHWSHNWVIGCVHFRCRLWPDWVIALPVLFALYRKHKDCDQAAGRPFRSRHELAAAMLARTRAALPGRKIEVGADGQYATQVLCGALRPGEDLVSRIRSDAAVYALPAERRPPGRRGRTPRKGKRLPAPRVMAGRRTKGWRTIRVRAYGKVVEKKVLSIVCLWPQVCKYNPIKLLIVRDPEGRQRDDFFFCTDPGESDEQVVGRAAARWPIEECIRDGKQHGGFEKVQGWCPRTVERQAPFALLVQTLVKAWYVRHAAGEDAARVRPKGHEACGWLRKQKAHPSYLDMLATLRRVLWEDRINSNSTLTGRARRIWNVLQFTLCAAA
ncbi:MAG: transposase [Actinobacteria bacterium]|nr:transposase [Actinomycetota bacterium]